MLRYPVAFIVIAITVIYITIKENQNEIDLVAVNDLRKEVVFADIKLDSSRINLKALKEKASKLEDEYKGYKKEWLGLHIQNIREFVK